MGLKADLSAEVKATFDGRWEEQTATTVPDPSDLRLNANHAKNFEKATILYADLDGSTNMVDRFNWWFSAEVYKAYLRCAAGIIRAQGGVITAYDGDRVMAVFTGKAMNTDAVRAALKINGAVHDIIRPTIKAKYPDVDFLLNHVIGIDTSPLRAARIGIHGDNDLVWVGRAANHAAKLTNISKKPIWITKEVFDVMNKEVKYSGENLMWDKWTWNTMGNREIYSSTYKITLP